MCNCLSLPGKAADRLAKGQAQHKSTYALLMQLRTWAGLLEGPTRLGRNMDADEPALSSMLRKSV